MRGVRRSLLGTLLAGSPLSGVRATWEEVPLSAAERSGVPAPMIEYLLIGAMAVVVVIYGIAVAWITWWAK